MSRLKAEDAHKLANDSSVILQEKLDEIFRLIEQTAKEGRFKLSYMSEVDDVNLIAPIKEELEASGYTVTSFSLKDISLVINW